MRFVMVVYAMGMGKVHPMERCILGRQASNSFIGGIVEMYPSWKIFVYLCPGVDVLGHNCSNCV